MQSWIARISRLHRLRLRPFPPERDSAPPSASRRAWLLALLWLLGPSPAVLAAGASASPEPFAAPSRSLLAQASAGQKEEEVPAEIKNLAKAALAAYAQGDAAEALRLQLQVMAWVKDRLERVHPFRVKALNNLSILLSALGRRDEATLAAQEAVRESRELVAFNSALRADLAVVLNTLSHRYSEQGDRQQALLASEEAVQIWRDLAKSNLASRRSLAAALNVLASRFADLGRDQEALLASEEAVALYRRLGQADLTMRIDLAMILNDLAVSYSEAGRPQEALRATSEAVKLYRELVSANPDLRSELAMSLNNLGVYYSEMGLRLEALAPTQEAVRLHRELADDHPDKRSGLAMALNSLGIRYGNLGLHRQALQPSEESVNLYRLLVRTKPTYRHHLAEALSNLSIRYGLLSRTREALPPALEALEIQRALAHENPGSRADLASAMNNLGVLYSDLNEQDKALVHADQAVMIYRQIAPASSSYRGDLAMALSNLADLKQRQAMHEPGSDLLLEMVGIEVEKLQRLLPLFPERWRQAFVETYGLRWQQPFSFATQGKAGARAALFTRLNRHGLLLDLQRSQFEVARSSSVEPLLNQLRGLANRLSNITLAQEGLQELQERQEELEQELYLQLPALRPKIIDLDAVRQALPAGGVLVEFQRHWDYDPTEPLKQRLGNERYLALLLKPNGEIQAVPLGEAAPIDAAITVALAATAENQVDAMVLWARVSQQILTPLQPHLTGVKQLFLSPDGELNRVPFAALTAPGGGGRLLAEAFQLRLLTSGRDLLRLQQPSRPGGAPVVMADPQYGTPVARGRGGSTRLQERSGVGLASAAAARETALTRTSVPMTTAANASALSTASAPPSAPVTVVSSANTPLTASGRFTGPTQLRSSEITAGTFWKPLPATREEARQVAALLPGSRVLLGSEATAAVALQQKAPRIVHIATHGFFVAEQPTTPAAPQAEVGAERSRGLSLNSAGSGLVMRQADADPFPFTTREDPLLRSGLVLAGANNPQADPADDGYLTAAEILGMDLEGTELVTLSACQTGLGEARTGEGVYGLQRSLAVAGARSSLLSLWKVDDAATAAFMTAYYRRLSRGEGRAEALAATQADFRTHENTDYRDPFVWAAFQLSGDWRPIPGMAPR